MWLHCVSKCTHEILHLPSLPWIVLCHHNMWFLPLRAAIKRLYHYLNDKTRTLGMIICSSARCYQYKTHPLLVTADGWSVSEVIYPLTSSVSGTGGKTSAALCVNNISLEGLKQLAVEDRILSSVLLSAEVTLECLIFSRCSRFNLELPALKHLNMSQRHFAVFWRRAAVLKVMDSPDDLHDNKRLLCHACVPVLSLKCRLSIC